MDTQRLDKVVLDCLDRSGSRNTIVLGARGDHQTSTRTLLLVDLAKSKQNAMKQCVFSIVAALLFLLCEKQQLISCPFIVRSFLVCI